MEEAAAAVRAAEAEADAKAKAGTPKSTTPAAPAPVRSITSDENFSNPLAGPERVLIVVGDLGRPWPDAKFSWHEHPIGPSNQKSYLNAVAAAVMKERGANRTEFNASSSDKYRIEFVRSNAEFSALATKVSGSGFDEFYFVGHAAGVGRALLLLGGDDLIGASAISGFIRSAKMSPRVIGLFGCSIAKTDLVDRIMGKVQVRVIAASTDVALKVWFGDRGNSDQVDSVEFGGGYNISIFMRRHRIVAVIAVLLLTPGCQSKSGAYCRAADLLRANWPSYRSTSCTPDGTYCVLATDPADPEVACGAYRVASIYSPVGAALCAAPTISNAEGKWTLRVTAWAIRKPGGLQAGRLLIAADGTDVEVFSAGAKAEASQYWPKLEPVVRRTLAANCPLLAPE